MDIGDGKAGAVRQGQGATVGGLAAPLGIKDGALKGDAASAPRQGLCGQDEGGRPGAVGVLLIVGLGAVHGQ